MPELVHMGIDNIVATIDKNNRVVGCVGRY
jgi:hypothetical protein